MNKLKYTPQQISDDMGLSIVEVDKLIDSINKEKKIKVSKQK